MFSKYKSKKYPSEDISTSHFCAKLTEPQVIINNTINRIQRPLNLQLESVEFV